MKDIVFYCCILAFYPRVFVVATRTAHGRGAGHCPRPSDEQAAGLLSGDKAVFYTDGIVEAMNEKEEMFGFERLLEVVQECKAMPADSLLKEIMERVNEFAGGAAQHDDLTVIVLSVTD